MGHFLLGFPTSRNHISSKVLLYDTFTDPDGTPIANHVPEIRPKGALWLPSTNIIINSGAFSAKTNTGSQSAIDVGKSAYTITGIINLIQKPASGTIAFIIVRFIETFRRYQFAFDCATNDILIRENNGGGAVTKATGAGNPFTDGQSYSFTVTVTTSNLFGVINGGSVSYDSTLFNSITSIALPATNTASTKHSGDNLKVMAL